MEYAKCLSSDTIPKVLVDIRSEKGWLQRKVKDSKYTWTISGSRWNNLKERTREGTLWQRIPTYIGSTNAFISFDSFVEWSISQVGYEFNDYDLDSDILKINSKVYSPDHCLFIPKQLNRFLQSPKIGASGFRGITLDRTRNKLMVRCEVNTGFEKILLIGKLFNTDDMVAAKKAYIEAKNNAADVWRDTLKSGKYPVDQRVIDFVNNLEFSYD